MPAAARWPASSWSRVNRDADHLATKERHRLQVCSIQALGATAKSTRIASFDPERNVAASPMVNSRHNRSPKRWNLDLAHLSIRLSNTTEPPQRWPSFRDGPFPPPGCQPPQHFVKPASQHSGVYTQETDRIMGINSPICRLIRRPKALIRNPLQLSRLRSPVKVVGSALAASCLLAAPCLNRVLLRIQRQFPCSDSRVPAASTIDRNQGRPLPDGKPSVHCFPLQGRSSGSCVNGSY